MKRHGFRAFFLSSNKNAKAENIARHTTEKQLLYNDV